MRIGFDHGTSVYINTPIDEPDMVTWNSDNPFYKMLARMHRVVKDYDVPTFYWAVRNYRLPKTILPEVQLVHQQVIANQKCVLHGLRGNLKCLHDKRHHEYRNDDSAQQRLKRFRPTR
jgi:hypothetical protein